MDSGAVENLSFESIWQDELLPVVVACLEPSENAQDVVAQTSVARLHALIYRVCSAPPREKPSAQPERLYARLRAHLHAHASSVAKILCDILGKGTTASPHHPMHLVTGDYVAQNAHLLARFRQHKEQSHLCHGNVDREAYDLLLNYVHYWNAFSRGVNNLAHLFIFLDRVWAFSRQKLGADALSDVDRLALGPNLDVLDVRRTAQVAWKDQVLLALGEDIADAALSVVRTFCTESSRRWHHMPPEAGSSSNVVDALQTYTLAVHVDSFMSATVLQTLQSITEVGDAGVRREEPTILFTDGMPSTAVAGLSDAALVPDPLRGPEVNRKEIELSMYKRVFETPFLAIVQELYREESRALLAKLPVCNYVRIVEEMSCDELTRASKYVDPTTLEPLRKILEHSLVIEHASALYAEAKERLSDVSSEELRRLYSLLRRNADSVRKFHALLRNHVEAVGLSALHPWSHMEPSVRTSGNLATSFGEDSRQGIRNNALDGKNEIPNAERYFQPYSHRLMSETSPVAYFSVSEKSSAASFVHAAWSVFEKFSKLVDEAFGGDREFCGAVEQACERIMNSASGAADLLAQFAHEILEVDSAMTGLWKSTAYSSNEHNRKASEAEYAVVWMPRVTRLFRFLNEKDLFQRMYALKLSQRFICRTSKSQELEEKMLHLLRETCGMDYTSRLQRMMTDVNLSSQFSLRFEEARRSGAVPSHDRAAEQLEFNALVLSSSAWPGLKSSLVELCSEGESCVDQQTRGSALDDRPVTDAMYSEQDRASWPSLSGSSREPKSGDQISQLLDAMLSTPRSDLALASVAAMPSRLSRLESDFGEFYESVPGHEKRKIQWIYHLSTVDVIARLHENMDIRTTIELSLSQAAVLLQFNDHLRLSLKDIAQLMGVRDGDLFPVVGILVQSGVLRIVPDHRTCSSKHVEVPPSPTAIKTMSGDCVVEVNVLPVDQDSVPSYFRVSLMAYEGNNRSRVRRLKKDVETDRRQQIKACIVRIMKREKRKSQEELLRLAQAQMSPWFFAQEGDFVAGIAALVEQEYLAFDDGFYVYVT